MRKEQHDAAPFTRSRCQAVRRDVSSSACPVVHLTACTLIAAASQQVLQDLTELVTVNFTYIADVTREALQMFFLPASTPAQCSHGPQQEPASVRCMHGPEECMGNSQRLCVQRAGNARAPKPRRVFRPYDYMLSEYPDGSGHGPPLCQVSGAMMTRVTFKEG